MNKILENGKIIILVEMNSSEKEILKLEMEMIEEGYILEIDSTEKDNKGIYVVTWRF